MAEIIDLFTLFGPIPPRGGESGVAPLRALLARHGVSAAVTLATRAVYQDAAGGNAETRAACAGSGDDAPRLVPGAALDPRLAADADGSAGSRLLFVFPEAQGWPVAYAPLGARLRAFAASGTAAPPLFFLLSRPGDATAAGALLAQSGYAAPVVLGGLVGSALLAEALAVASENPRALVATDGLRGVGEIDAAVAALGAGRVVFASGAPRGSLGAALALVRQAALSETDQANVLGGNARALFTAGAGAAGGTS